MVRRERAQHGRVARDAPRAANHSTITGPNTRPMLPVPRRCAANSATITATETGSTNRFSPGAEISSPSTAESTEIDGVITPSPNSR